MIPTPAQYLLRLDDLCHLWTICLHINSMYNAEIE